MRPKRPGGRRSLGRSSIQAPARPRGIFTKAQFRGVDLARNAEIRHEGGSIWSVVDGDHTCVVNLERRESNCVEFRKSRPRVECSHHWAVLYTIAPPTLDEFQTPPLAQTEPVGEKPAPTKIPDASIVQATMAEVLRGGYTVSVCLAPS